MFDTKFFCQRLLGRVQLARIVRIGTVGTKKQHTNAVLLRGVHECAMSSVRSSAVEAESFEFRIAAQAASPFLQDQCGIAPGCQFTLYDTTCSMLIDALATARNHLDLDWRCNRVACDRRQMRRQIVSIAQTVTNQEHTLRPQ